MWSAGAQPFLMNTLFTSVEKSDQVACGKIRHPASLYMNTGTFICHTISTQYFRQHTKLTLITAVTCLSCSCGPNRKTKLHSMQPVRIPQLSLSFVDIFACEGLRIFVTSVSSTPCQDSLHPLHVTYFSGWSLVSQKYYMSFF